MITKHFFNTTGPCNPERHYMLSPEEHLVGAQLHRYIALVGMRDLKDYITASTGGRTPNPGSSSGIRIQKLGRPHHVGDRWRYDRFGVLEVKIRF